VHADIHKLAAPALKYWQLRRSGFYVANSITIIAAIYAQLGAAPGNAQFSLLKTGSGQGGFELSFRAGRAALAPRDRLRISGSQPRRHCGLSRPQPIILAGGAAVTALVPLYRGPNIIPTSSASEIAAMATRAKGVSGSCADYIKAVADQLGKLGVDDPVVVDLCAALATRE
jgi:hypothetical protein